MTSAGDSPSPWPHSPPSDRDRASYADAEPSPFWLVREPAPEPCPPLQGAEEADLAIVGGGLTGLWAAVQAKEDDPARDVAVLEAESVAFGASGRNGGFVSSSLTHGIANGLDRFPDEIEELERLGMRNWEGIREALERYGIECDLEPTGALDVAFNEGQLADLAEHAEDLRRLGHEAELLDEEAVRAEVESPIYRGGLWQRSGNGILDPAKLARGLRRAALELGVRVHEGTRVERIGAAGAGVELRAPGGRLRAARVLLATSAYPPLLGAMRRRIVPVYDYALVSEPLSAAQREAIRWRNRQGSGDSAHQFHYYRLTGDDRILWGGFDAIYHYANGVRPELDQREASFAGLAQRFFVNFPQLEGLRFSHRWGGAIDTCGRFSVFFGTAERGRVAYAIGYTGLGVGASRFGARVALDLLDRRETEATRLRYVRRRPPPFPPEPLRWLGIQITRNRIAAADRRGGRPGLWLRLLDRAGLGFDS